MKVGALIEALQQFDPDEEVGVYDNGPGNGANEIIQVELVTDSLFMVEGAPYGKFEKRRIVLITMDGHA